MSTCRLCLSAERRLRATGVSANARKEDSYASLTGRRRAASLPAASGLCPGVRDPRDVAACTGAAARHRVDGDPATDGGAAWGSSRCHPGPPPVNHVLDGRLHGRRSSSAYRPASLSPIDSDITPTNGRLGFLVFDQAVLKHRILRAFLIFSSFCP
ncbi:hypothetical protein HPB50_012273 [Hyalomma asiaticum]|uniref:Uncharacterized protein n=1 Tax=Hyalomma asiaticum TaxID=266040 RepID=A0ACB7S8I5_HYAAI|nr:hypothetical protein HPB50_012273 [Hyalomma asiaticum]